MKGYTKGLMKIKVQLSVFKNKFFQKVKIPINDTLNINFYKKVVSCYLNFGSSLLIDNIHFIKFIYH